MKEFVADNMVLRTIFLPPALDGRISALAFSEGISKGDVIREMLARGLALSKKKTLAEQLTAAARARKTAARQKASSKRQATKPAKKAIAKKVILKPSAQKAIVKKASIKRKALPGRNK